MEVETEKDKIKKNQQNYEQIVESIISKQTDVNGEIAFIMSNGIDNDQEHDLGAEAIRRIYDWNLVLNNKKLIRKYYPLLQEDPISLQEDQNTIEIELQDETIEEMKQYAQMIKFSSDEMLQGLQSAMILVKSKVSDQQNNIILKSIQLIKNFDLQESSNSIKQDIRVTYISIGDPFESNDREYLKCLQSKKAQTQYIQLVPHNDFRRFNDQSQQFKQVNSKGYNFINHPNLNMPQNSYICLINSHFEETSIILFEQHLKRIIKDFKSKICILTYDPKCILTHNQNMDRLFNIKSSKFPILIGQIIRKVSRMFQNQIIIIPQIYSLGKQKKNYFDDWEFQVYKNSDTYKEDCAFEEFQIKSFINSFNACMPVRQNIYKSFISSYTDDQIFQKVQILCHPQEQIKLQIPKAQLYVYQSQTYQLKKEGEEIQKDYQELDQQYIFLLRKTHQENGNTNEESIKLHLKYPIIIDDRSIIQIDYPNEEILIVQFFQYGAQIYQLGTIFDQGKNEYGYKIICEWAQTNFSMYDTFYLSDHKVYVFGYQEAYINYWQPTLHICEGDQIVQYAYQEAKDKKDKYCLNGARKDKYSIIKCNLNSKSEKNTTYFTVVGGKYDRDTLLQSGLEYNAIQNNIDVTKNQNKKYYAFTYNCTLEQIKIDDNQKQFERITIDKQNIYSPNGTKIQLKECLNPYLVYCTSSSFYYIENQANYDNFAKEPSIYRVEAILPKIIITKFSVNQKSVLAFQQLYLNMNPFGRNHLLTNNNQKLELINIYNSNKRSKGSDPLLLGQRKVRVCQNLTFEFLTENNQHSVSVDIKTQCFELKLPKSEAFKVFRYKNWIEQMSDTYIYNGEQRNQYILFYKSGIDQNEWISKTFSFVQDNEFKQVYQDFSEVACHDVQQNAIFVARKYYPCDKGSFKLFACLCSNFQDLKEQESDISLQIDIFQLKIIGNPQEYGDYQSLLVGAYLDDQHLYVKFNQKLAIFDKKITKKDQKFQIALKQIIDYTYEIQRCLNFKEKTQIACNQYSMLIYYERIFVTYNTEEQKIQGVFSYVLIQNHEQNKQPTKQQITFDLSLYERQYVNKIQLKINDVQLGQEILKVNLLELCDNAGQVRHQQFRIENSKLKLLENSTLIDKRFECRKCFTSLGTNRQKGSFCYQQEKQKEKSQGLSIKEYSI